MIKLFILLLFVCVNSVAETSSEILYKELKNIPDNELAMCRTKSNDFWFFCSLNRKTYYNCKVGLGSKFTIKKCEPVACVPCNETKTPVKEPVNTPVKTQASNPVLDVFKKSTENKKPEPVKPKISNPLLDALKIKY